MDLCLALDIQELLALDSRIVGGSIAERLFRRSRSHRTPGTPVKDQAEQAHPADAHKDARG
jgi:hypothetical protein